MRQRHLEVARKSAPVRSPRRHLRRDAAGWTSHSTHLGLEPALDARHSLIQYLLTQNIKVDVSARGNGSAISPVARAPARAPAAPRFPERKPRPAHFGKPAAFVAAAIVCLLPIALVRNWDTARRASAGA